MSRVERLFVGNLPENITEQEIRNEFSSYGGVKGIELKSKPNLPGNPDKLNVFAFITIAINSESLKTCLQEFREYKFQNRFLTVSVARENFLDKLKREREEASKPTTNVDHSTKPYTPVQQQVSLPKLAEQNDSSSDAESSSSESHKKEVLSNPFSNQRQRSPTASGDEEDLVNRKKSKHFLQNGKIKIDSVNTSGPIHIVQKYAKQENKEIHGKAKESDQKRLDSMKKMKEDYNQKQQLIKQSLTNPVAANTKIVFDIESATQKSHTKKPLLFAENDSDNDNDHNFIAIFANRNEYQGAAGLKLQKLNMKYGGDTRFQMDKAFLDEQLNNEEEENDKMKNSERNWQFNVLENIIGHKLQSDVPKDKSRVQKTMLRYDPSQESHTKYLTKSKETNHSVIDQVTTTKTTAATKESFYKVSDTIQNSLHDGSGNFSLLSMFGLVKENSQATVAEPQSAYQEVLQNKVMLKPPIQIDNPFKYDSSDDDEEDTVSFLSKGQNETSVEKSSKNAVPKKPPAVYERFFFTSFATDERLQEGIQFFLPTKETEQDETLIQQKKEDMRNIVKKKMKRAIKSKLPHGAKPNRKFRKFARNL